MSTIYSKDKNNQIYIFSSKEEFDSYTSVELIEITSEEAQMIASPPLTQEELNIQKEAENTSFLSSETRRVNDAIAPLDDAIEFEIATEDEIHKHTELRKYRLLLSRVPNQDTWPLDPTWPTCPEFFKPKEQS